jgi:hypothetical protein
MSNLKEIILLIIIFILGVSAMLYVYQRQTKNGNLDLGSLPSPEVTQTRPTPTPTSIPTAGAKSLSSQPATGNGDREIKNIGITIENPTSAEIVSSPLKIKGRANVFEGNVVIRIIDANGSILGQTTATACMDYDACPFVANVTFTKPQTVTGLLEVYGTSGLDGSPTYLQQISVNF